MPCRDVAAIQQSQPRIDMQKAEYHEFKGGHTIPPDVVDRFVQILVAQSAEALCSLSIVSSQGCGCPTHGVQTWKLPYVCGIEPCLSP